MLRRERNPPFPPPFSKWRAGCLRQLSARPWSVSLAASADRESDPTTRAGSRCCPHLVRRRGASEGGEHSGDTGDEGGVGRRLQQRCPPARTTPSPWLTLFLQSTPPRPPLVVARLVLAGGGRKHREDLESSRRIGEGEEGCLLARSLPIRGNGVRVVVGVRLPLQLELPCRERKFAVLAVVNERSR